jgi:hypothetical protein
MFQRSTLPGQVFSFRKNGAGSSSISHRSTRTLRPLRVTLGRIPA